MEKKAHNELSSDACLMISTLLRKKETEIEDSIEMDKAHVNEMQFLNGEIHSQELQVWMMHRVYGELSEFGCSV